MTVYITLDRIDHTVRYVGTDKEAALDARRSVDEICLQQTLSVAKDFTFTLTPLVN